MISPRLLSPAIVVDANILISAVLGSATGAYFDRVAGERSLMTSEAAMREASRVVGHIRPLDLPVLDALLDLVTIVPREDVRAADLEDAEQTLAPQPLPKTTLTSWRWRGPSMPTSGATTGILQEPAGHPGQPPTS